MTLFRLHARPAALLLLGLVLCAARAPVNADPALDEDRPARFDYGFGVGVRVPDAQSGFWRRIADRLAPRRVTPFDTERALRSLPRGLVDPPSNGGPDAASIGVFGPVLAWPIIPLHMALLPDGRVLTYGTDQNGRQGALSYYDVWDPTQPYPVSQTVLPNTTGTDIFCSGMGLLASGQMLITGGDLTIGKTRNYSNASVNLFNAPVNSLVPDGTMNFPRWYPSDVPLPGGDQLIIGGRSSQKPVVPVNVPEYYSAAANSFTPLTGINLPQVSWFYPRTFVTSGGGIDVLDLNGKIWSLSLGGAGSAAYTGVRAAAGLDDLPTQMFSPGRLLSVRKADSVGPTSETYAFDLVDLTGAAPVVTQMADVPGLGREWSNLTTLADGTLLINGGSGTSNVLSMVSYQAALYNPTLNSWTLAATAAEPRLYHSAALLLADGTVLTGGGGAPGPVNELNAEIYYPPYLFLPDGSGNFAPRPVIAAAPASLAPGDQFTLQMADGTPITAVNFVRAAAVTHSASLQSRFISASFSQDGSVLSVNAPANPNDLLTGYWMIFVFNATGTPSIASIVNVGAPAQSERAGRAARPAG